MPLEFTQDEQRRRLAKALEIGREIGFSADDAAGFLTDHDIELEKLVASYGLTTSEALLVSDMAGLNARTITVSSIRNPDGSLNERGLRCSRAMLDMVAWIIDRNFPELKK